MGCSFLIRAPKELMRLVSQSKYHSLSLKEKEEVQKIAQSRRTLKPRVFKKQYR